MKQKLEDFIRRNRDAFDDREPADSAWDRIANTLPGVRPSLWNRVAVWRAAAVLFMGLSLYLALSSRTTSNQQASSADTNRQEMRAFADVEKYYTDQIAQTVQLIDLYGGREGLNGFTQDIHQLEAMYLVLKEEMERNPSDKVRDALVLNLLVRIDLLTQHLQKLDAGASGAKGDRAS
ncbi:MAG TPA: hypothetical protein VF191_12980 [Cyclobacteriaceae bacterium]